MDQDLTSISLLGRLRDPADGDAWDRFNEIYSTLIEGWLRRQGVPEDVAEDVRQDVFTKVFEEIGIHSWTSNANVTENKVSYEFQITS